MHLVAASIYWLIVAIWTTVLSVVVTNYLRNPRAFGTTRLLLAVIAIDTSRNIIENIYFGLYFGSSYGFFPKTIIELLGNPYLLIIPKVANVASGCLVIVLLLSRWLPAAILERRTADQTIDELRELATVDQMTGLLNKSHFDELAAAELKRCERHDRPLSLIVVDIDFFKSVNDNHGHEVGDRVIVQIANACRDQRRASDIVARLGGEEFALLLPETDLNAAGFVAERLRNVISRNVLALPDRNLMVTVSVGVGEAKNMYNLKALHKQADVALYSAKRAGRNRVVLYDCAA